MFLSARIHTLDLVHVCACMELDKKLLLPSNFLILSVLHGGGGGFLRIGDLKINVRPHVNVAK